MRQFLSLRNVMLSNVSFEKNKMTPTLAASVITTCLFTKCKEAERRVKFKGNSAMKEKLKKTNQFFLGKLSAGKTVLQISYNNKTSYYHPNK